MQHLKELTPFTTYVQPSLSHNCPIKRETSGVHLGRHKGRELIMIAAMLLIG